MTLLFECFMCR